MGMPPATAPARPRAAFTLVELLIVIAIIAVLGGLLLPAASLIQRQMKDVKCSNHLRQLAAGVMAYQTEEADGRDWFPGRLGYLFDENRGYPLAGETKKILACPHDPYRGSSRASGRHIGGTWGNFEHLMSAEPYDLSYFYEVSEEPHEDPVTGVPYDWVDGATFFDTWADYKRWQKRLGNHDGSGTNRRPFPASVMPIIRCYWHHQWTGTPDDATRRRVNNVSWNGEIFWSIPYWEHQANPAIPLP